MVKITGKLVVRKVTGRFGLFSVGHLTTDIGDFVVKDKKLEEYSEGCYKGEFCITKICQSSYIIGGRAIFEIRATLDEFVLSKITKRPKNGHKLKNQEVNLVEDRKKPENDISILPQKDKISFSVTPKEKNIKFSSLNTNNDEELFGTVWPLGHTVRLDKTIERSKLCKQRDRLIELGYKIAPDQAWYHSQVS